MGREQLRTTFEEVPELYDRARPTYPAAIFDDLEAVTELRAGARVLEIGCGTGQATIPLAERGLDVTCIELGKGLAALAQRRLARFPNVEIVKSAFETWEAPNRQFDAVVAFTAFHWIDPDVRYTKSARLLRDGGFLATVRTKHVLPDGGDPFFADVQEDYRAITPDEDNSPPPRPEEVHDTMGAMEAGGLFTRVAVRRYLWDVTYSAYEYIDVLNTYSGHRALEATTRQRLYDRIRKRVEAQPRQTVRKTYLAILDVGRRL
jgi:SAM-dependent methyltransferase